MQAKNFSGPNSASLIQVNDSASSRFSTFSSEKEPSMTLSCAADTALFFHGDLSHSDAKQCIQLYIKVRYLVPF